MGKYSDDVKKINGAHQTAPKTKSTYHAVQCNANDCPIVRIVPVDANTALCQYHERAEPNQFPAVTQRIIENKRWVDGYRKMVRWESSDWTRYKQSLTGCEFLPMKEHEPPTMYINRYLDKLNEVIL